MIERYLDGLRDRGYIVNVYVENGKTIIECGYNDVTLTNTLMQGTIEDVRMVEILNAMVDDLGVPV